MNQNSLRSDILGAAATEFGRHRAPVFVSDEDLHGAPMPEYQLMAEYDAAKEGYWVWVEPVPKTQRATKLVPYIGDPGDEHQ